MKIYLPLLMIFISLLCFGFFIINSLSQNAENITENFTEIFHAIKEDNWLKVTEDFSAVKKEWLQYKKWLPMIIDHQEIDNVDICISRLDEYLNYQNSVLAAGELSALEQLLKLIPANEKINWENIF